MKTVKYAFVYGILFLLLLFAVRSKMEWANALEASSLIFLNSRRMLQIGFGRLDFLFTLGYLAVLWVGILFGLSSAEDNGNDYRAMVMYRYETRKAYFFHSLGQNIRSAARNTGLLLPTFTVLLFAVGVMGMGMKAEPAVLPYLCLYGVQLTALFSWLGLLNRLLTMLTNSGMSFCLTSIVTLLAVVPDAFLDCADWAVFSNHLPAAAVGLGINIILNCLCGLACYMAAQKCEL